MQKDLEYQTAQIEKNLKAIHSRMARAAEKTDRDLSEIKLIAVTKLTPLETIRAAIGAGLRCFGENYPEQAAEKIVDLKTDQVIEWHMIGHIQSRKANTVCEYFNMVHSLDRMKIASYLNRFSGEVKRRLPVLIEVNVSGEESKYGWQASNEATWNELVPQFKQIAGLPNLEIRGLMSMPPLFEDAELTRPMYRKLRKLQQFLKDRIPEAAWDELSIGTSFDFEVAIEEGATMVRIGTEIFGKRQDS